MAKENIKKGWALPFLRGVAFALLTYVLALAIMTWMMNPLTELPLWADRLLGVVVAVGFGFIIRGVLSKNQRPNVAEIGWATIWATITYALSGWLVGPDFHTRLMGTLGISGNFLTMVLVIIAVGAIALNGFTFVAKSLTIWVDELHRSFWTGAVLLWLLAMVFTWFGTIIFPQLACHWWPLAIYWAVSIWLTGNLRKMSS